MVTVIKAGGSILQKGAGTELMKKIISMGSGNSILVHGGGPTVTSLCESLGISPKFITSPNGIRSRYTDYETMQAFIMAMRGKINTEIVVELQKLGIRSVGISGIDGPTLIAERKGKLLTINERGRKMVVDGGYTGRIIRVDPALIFAITESGRTPVVSPIALSTEYEPLNVDGDRAAAAIAGAVQADELFLLTNVDGVILDGGTVDRIRQDEIPGFMKRVGSGMDKKLMAAEEALKGGCRKVIIANGNTGSPEPGSTDHEMGTVITA